MNSIDIELLRGYLQRGSEEAFAELVRRHIDLVYSAALRQVNGNRQHAEDVTQTVFTDLARKAAKLTRHTSLAGWLYTSTRYATAALRRSESRRWFREQKAYAMNPSVESTDAEPDWEHLRPILDAAMHELKQDDREAILLRYFEKLPLGEVGTRLGISENTARMRIERATDKLRTRLAARGISSTAVALGSALAQQAVSPAPATLSLEVASQALAAGGQLGGAGAGGWPAWGLAGKAAIVTGAAVLLIMLGGLGKPKSTAKDLGTRVSSNVSSETAPAQSNVPAPAAATANPAEPPAAGVRLYFVDDRTGQPVTNTVVSLRGWERGSHTLVEKILPLDQGRCSPPFDPNYGPGYWILTHVEGYADVSLQWRPRQGDLIPDSYIVRLVQPVLIGGRVVDPSGNPVPGAEVAFGNNQIPASGTAYESHQLEHITTLTDAQGHWQFNRIAPEVLRYLIGGASHPDFAQSQRVDVSLQPDAGQQLLEGTYVFRLGAGTSVSGVVIDVTGQPVAGALVHVGWLSETGSRDGHSAANGTFQVTGCRGGAQLVTASAEGLAPAVRAVNMNTNPGPLKFVLGQGKPLRVRVVDAQGIPLMGATVWYNAFSPTRKGPFPQVNFNEKSDTDGRIVWEHAPDQQMDFYCSAPGYMQAENLLFRPSDEEHVVTLGPALVVRGTVRDADSGELVPHFRLGIGWPPDGPNGTQPHWVGIDRFWPSFTGGTFEHSIEEPVVGGTANRGYIFRFEAEGHSPYVTRVYRPDEGEVWLDIKLAKAEETMVAIYTPDGRAATDAQIGLLAPGTRLKLVPGGFSTENEASTWLRKADAHGRFVLPTDETVTRVVVAHPEGYVECTPAELRTARAVRLQPWASVEGVWLIGQQPAAQREVMIDYPAPARREIELELPAFRATTDNDGRFVFPQVPPGELDVLTWRDSADGNGTKYGVRLGRVQAIGGQTNQVVLAGNRYMEHAKSSRSNSSDNPWPQPAKP